MRPEPKSRADGQRRCDRKIHGSSFTADAAPKVLVVARDRSRAGGVQRVFASRRRRRRQRPWRDEQRGRRRGRELRRRQRRLAQRGCRGQSRRHLRHAECRRHEQRRRRGRSAEHISNLPSASQSIPGHLQRATEAQRHRSNDGRATLGQRGSRSVDARQHRRADLRLAQERVLVAQPGARRRHGQALPGNPRHGRRELRRETRHRQRRAAGQLRQQWQDRHHEELGAGRRYDAQSVRHAARLFRPRHARRHDFARGRSQRESRPARRRR